MPRLAHHSRRPVIAALVAALAATAASTDASAQTRGDIIAAPATEAVGALAGTLKVGDIVFTRIGAYPFRKVAEATGTWTNHVGIVLDVSGKEPVIGESRFPFSGSTTLSRFVARSAGSRVAVMRLPTKQRAVFNMKYFDEMKYEEMSAVTGTSVGALKASYHIATKKIESWITAPDQTK